MSETKSLFQVNVATKDPFPDNTSAKDTLLAIYRNVAREQGKDIDLTRIRTDAPFRKDVTDVVSELEIYSCH